MDLKEREEKDSKIDRQTGREREIERERPYNGLIMLDCLLPC